MYKIVSISQFIEILINSISDNSHDTVNFKNYEIKGNILDFNESLNITQGLIFENCIFTLEYPLMFRCKFKEFIIFRNCSIKRGIFILNAIFENLFELSNVDIYSINIIRGDFKEIEINTYNTNKILFSEGSFDNLNLNSDKLDCLLMTFQPSFGNLIIKDQMIKNIFIKGNLKDKKIEIINCICNNICFKYFTNDGILHLSNLKPSPTDKNNKYFQIINSNLEKAQFFRINFSEFDELIIIDSFISDTKFINCSWKNNIRALEGTNLKDLDNISAKDRRLRPDEYSLISESYRQLKISMSKLDDKIQENKFYKNELNYHNKTIKWASPLKNDFWDKVILSLSNSLSEYGQSFIKPFLYLLLGHFALFSVAILLNGFDNLQFSLFDASWNGLKLAFEKFFIYINPLRRTDTSFSGYLIILDILMRIWSSYMIYNIVRATRRFIN